jgi:hypothetical protein
MLTVLKFSRRERKNKQLLYYWVCKCECGIEKEISMTNFVYLGTKSCGCKRLGSTHRQTHGLYYTPEHNSWNGMLQRCLNPNNKAYNNYGKRGISVCKRWLKFDNFIKDMGVKPNNDYSLERINNNKGYSPSNCAWRPFSDQANNKRTNVFINYGGKSQTVAQWARELNVKDSLLSRRLTYKNWAIKDVLFCPKLQ